jgi:group I intron endonuclease
MQYTIYLRTNTANGKQYVGQTSDFKRRERHWNCLKIRYANEHICNDREKYGLDAWTVKVLAECDGREDAWELEQRFINDFNTLWPNGYNLAKGGAGPKGIQFTDEHKRKISEAQKGENNPMYGKHLSDETKQKISEAKKIPVYQYTKNGELVGIWKSATDASEELGINQSHISACCHGKVKSAGGYIWSFNPL